MLVALDSTWCVENESAHHDILLFVVVSWYFLRLLYDSHEILKCHGSLVNIFCTTTLGSDAFTLGRCFVSHVSSIVFLDLFLHQVRRVCMLHWFVALLC